MSGSSDERIIPHENDVLMGRGGKNNQHVGNEKLRELARAECENYRKSSKKGKSYISRKLVSQVREMNPPGRFLKRDQLTATWEDVGDEIAREKASQVLRDAVSNQQEEEEEEQQEIQEQVSPTPHPRFGIEAWPRAASEGAIPSSSRSTGYSYESPTRSRTTSRSRSAGHSYESPARNRENIRSMTDSSGNYAARTYYQNERRHRSLSTPVSIGRVATTNTRQSAYDYYRGNEFGQQQQHITPMAIQPQHDSTSSEVEPIPFPPVTPISTSNRKRRRYYTNNAPSHFPYEYNATYSTQMDSPSTSTARAMTETPQASVTSENSSSSFQPFHYSGQERAVQQYEQQQRQQFHPQQPFQPQQAYQLHQSYNQQQTVQQQQQPPQERLFSSQERRSSLHHRMVPSQAMLTRSTSIQSASSQGLLGDMQENMGDFDLFDGELIEGKSEIEDSFGYGSDPF